MVLQPIARPVPSTNNYALYSTYSPASVSAIVPTDAMKQNMEEYNLRKEISTLGQNVQMPNSQRNYCIFDENKVKHIASYGEKALPHIKEYLQSANNNFQVLETLSVLNEMADNNVEGLADMYPYLARFNNTNSPEVQVMLAGIYRKTLVPDAFGPLNRMLHNQIVHPNSPFFDPTEEIGGAILEYMSSYGAKTGYKNDTNDSCKASNIVIA